MTTTPIALRRSLPLLLAMALLAPLAGWAQSNAKKELVARILKSQQADLDQVARSVVERPAAQMMQEAGLYLQQKVPAEKREAAGRAIEAEVKKFIDESYPLVRERATRLAPTTIGAVLEEKLTEDELRQFASFLESSANKKYQQLGPDMRNAFIGKLLTESQPVVDPKLTSLDGRIRSILGVGPAVGAAPVPGAVAPPLRPGAVSRPVLPAAPAPAPRASGQ